MREKFWELAGTKLGNLLKINKEVEKLENSAQPLGNLDTSQLGRGKDEDEVDYRAESQYAEALKKKHEAVSEFAKSKTIKE
jgi:pre-mRNA-splicing factor ATP-dependent RNA helicase DHX38/PRP16